MKSDDNVLEVGTENIFDYGQQFVVAWFCYDSSQTFFDTSL
jgi:hypothetical protein